MTDIVLIDYNGPAVEKPRVRQLDNWIFCFAGGSKVFLKGGIISENGVPIPEDQIRLTTTSFIAKIEGRIAITESGSRYELLTPIDPKQEEALLLISSSG